MLDFESLLATCVQPHLLMNAFIATNCSIKYCSYGSTKLDQKQE